MDDRARPQTHETGQPDAAAPRPKAAYETPRLERLGTVESLTEGLPLMTVPDDGDFSM